MHDEIDRSAETADFEASDAQDNKLPVELENTIPDEPEFADEVDLPDPGLKGV